MDKVLEILIGIITPLAGLAAFVFGVIKGTFFSFRKLIEKSKLTRKDGKSFYYDRKGRQYCPWCYETKKLKSKIRDSACTACGRIYSNTPVIEVRSIPRKSFFK